MRSLEIEIILNQVAQGVRSLADAEDLLSDPEVSETLWSVLTFMVYQAHPTSEDVADAISEAGLKPSYTPCVLLLKDQGQFQIQKIASLPRDEWSKALRLLIEVFRVSDNKRKAVCGTNCHHGWHADFGDVKVLSVIRERGYI